MTPRTVLGNAPTGTFGDAFIVPADAGQCALINECPDKLFSEKWIAGRTVYDFISYSHS